MSSQSSSVSSDSDTSQDISLFTEESVLQAITKAVKECLKRERMKFKHEELKAALLQHVYEDDWDPESATRNEIVLIRFNNRCIRLTINGAKITIKLFVSQIQKDFCSNTLHDTGRGGKENEYVLLDINRGHRNCFYVVQRAHKIHGETPQPYFLCYDVSGIGERQRRWPEIPVLPNSEMSLRLYSID